ncbi:MAG: class I SAM-dependent methyltransferase [Acidobacteriota bacterium]
MNTVIEEIHRTGVVFDGQGQEYPAHSHIDPAEGAFVGDLIRRDASVLETLEVGCAYGLSSLHICDALSGRDGAHHTIIDPFQHSEWHGVGLANLERAGFTGYTWRDELSELALPEIAKQEAGTFDLVFIDGCHTFDHTLLDLFYAIRLVRVGGYIVLDDCIMPPVAKAAAYVLNYPALELFSQVEMPRREMTWRRRGAALLNRLTPRLARDWIVPRALYDRFFYRFEFSTMIALRKIAEDERGIHWFEPF